jgi:hypothetical protein
VKQIIQLLLPEDNPKYFIILGDYVYFLGLRPYQYIAFGLYMVLALTSQMIYYYNYKNDIKPNFLKVFEMISGLVSPKSIGLTDRKEIHKLVKISKTLFSIWEIIANILNPLIVFTLNFVPLYINCTYTEILIYALPHSITFAMAGYYTVSLNGWQVIYLFITCRYINIKLREMNQKIKLINNSRMKANSSYIKPMISSLNSIFSDVHEYNTSYLSKYLLSIWLLQGSVIINILYSILFMKLNAINKLIFIYAEIIVVTAFVLIMNTASSVNYEVNKLYKILNSVMAHNVYNLRIYHQITDNDRYLFSMNMKVN